MTQSSPSEPASRALVTATVLFYLVAALAMVMANKWVLNTTSAPLFFLFTQLLIAVLLFVVFHIIGIVKVPMKFDMPLLKGLAPVVILNVVGLSFTNFTLKYVDASFYQVARGLVLPFTVLTSNLFLHAKPSRAILASCAVVTLGFLTGAFLDGANPSPLGIACGVASSITTAVQAVLLKRAIGVLGGGTLDLAWYSNLLSATLLAPIVLIAGEGPAIVALFFGENERGSDSLSTLGTFMWGSAITGVFGFLMCLASLLSLKITSPITHMISSAVRGVASSFLGMWLFHDIISTGRAASIAIILAGSIYYTWVKHVESVPKDGYERVPMQDVEAGKLASGNRKEDA